MGFAGARNTCLKATMTPFPHGARGPRLRGREEGVGSRARPGESQGVTGAAAAAAPASRSGSRDKVFFFSGFFWMWGGDSGGPHRTNAGRGCSSPSNWRSQWEAVGPAAPAARGRGGNLANLPSLGGGREGRSGARPEAGRAGARGGGGAAGPGAECRRACAGPRGCASRSRAPSRASPQHPGAVTMLSFSAF